MLHSSAAAAALLVIASPFVASFVATVVERSARNEPIVWCRSKCQDCATVLSPFQLVPVGSFLFLRGRCRHCASPIPRELFALECIYLAATSLVLVFPSDHELMAAVAFTWALLALAWFDWQQGRLPDALTLSLCFGGLIVAYHSGSNLFDCMLGALVGFVCSGLIAQVYRGTRGSDGLGGGDIKLFAAAGAWLGWEAMPVLFLLSSVSALVFAVLTGRRAASDALPFGPFIAAAAWGLWLWKGLLP